jgi:hypothetical protein
VNVPPTPHTSHRKVLPVEVLTQRSDDQTNFPRDAIARGQVLLGAPWVREGEETDECLCGVSISVTLQWVSRKIDPP